MFKFVLKFDHEMTKEYCESCKKYLYFIFDEYCINCFERKYKLDDHCCYLSNDNFVPTYYNSEYEEIAKQFVNTDKLFFKNNEILCNCDRSCSEDINVKCYICETKRLHHSIKVNLNDNDDLCIPCFNNIMNSGEIFILTQNKHLWNIDKHIYYPKNLKML